MQAREGSTPQQVIVDVNVEEEPTGSLSFGGSYSTTSGFGAAISFSERNFLGRGQRLRFTVNTGASSRQYAFNFTEPAFLGRDVALGLNLSYDETNQLSATYDTAAGLFQPSIAFPVSDNGRLQLRYGLRYTDLSLNDDSANDLGNVLTAEADLGERYDSFIGYTYSYDTRRTGLNPNAGVLFEFGQDFAGVGGDSTYIKSTLRAIGQTTALNEEVTLRTTLEAGALSFSDGRARSTDRFLLGPNVMRGFDYGGIGPREVGGGIDDPLGGNYFAVARFEAEFPLGLPEEYGISGGLFYDVGSVWGLSDATKANVGGNRIVSEGFEARHVVGFSVFWDSAIGPLRLNFSEPVQKTKWDEPLNFNLTVSTRF